MESLFVYFAFRCMIYKSQCRKALLTGFVVQGHIYYRKLVL